MGLGIGSEILCVLVGQLDTSGNEEATAVMVAAERVVRRWLTERGSCFWARSMGLGINLLMNADLTPGELRRVESDAAIEAKLEDGIAAAKVTATYQAGVLALVGKLTSDTGQEFQLTVRASGAAEVLFQ